MVWRIGLNTKSNMANSQFALWRIAHVSLQLVIVCNIRTAAKYMSIPIDIINACHRWPVLILMQLLIREKSLFLGIRKSPGV